MTEPYVSRRQQMAASTTPTDRRRPLPAMPADLITLDMLNDAAGVHRAITDYLRRETNEPSRRNDGPAAWNAWRDQWLGRIHDAAEAACTGPQTAAAMLAAASRC